MKHFSPQIFNLDYIANPFRAETRQKFRILTFSSVLFFFHRQFLVVLALTDFSCPDKSSVLIKPEAKGERWPSAGCNSLSRFLRLLAKMN